MAGGNPVWLCALHFTFGKMQERLYGFHYYYFSAGVSVLVSFEQSLQSRNGLFHFTIYRKCTAHTGIQTTFLNLYKIAQEILSAKDTEGILTLSIHKLTMYKEFFIMYGGFKLPLTLGDSLS